MNNSVRPIAIHVGRQPRLATAPPTVGNAIMKPMLSTTA